MKLLSTPNELKVDERNKHSELNKCMFQRSYTGTTYKHSGSHSRHSIHLRSNDLNNYGRQQRQEYNTGEQRQQALLLRVQHPNAANLHLLMAMAE